MPKKKKQRKKAKQAFLKNTQQSKIKYKTKKSRLTKSIIETIDNRRSRLTNEIKF